MLKVGEMHVEDLGQDKGSHLLKVYFPLSQTLTTIEGITIDKQVGVRGIILRIKPENLLIHSSDSDYIQYDVMGHRNA